MCMDTAAVACGRCVFVGVLSRFRLAQRPCYRLAVLRGNRAPRLLSGLPSGLLCIPWCSCCFMRWWVACASRSIINKLLGSQGIKLRSTTSCPCTHCYLTYYWHTGVRTPLHGGSLHHWATSTETHALSLAERLRQDARLFTILSLATTRRLPVRWRVEHGAPGSALRMHALGWSPDMCRRRQIR